MKKIVLILVILFSISISAGNLYAQASSHQIVGRWEYQSGFWLYFFGDSEIIEFRANGTAISYDEYLAGTWSISGQQLTIVYDYGRIEEFMFSIRNNLLTITDSDGDVGIWQRE